MNAQTMTQEEIVQAGLEAILRELGADGLVRFLQETGLGYGDYTAERHQWLDGLSIEELWAGTAVRPAADGTQAGAILPRENPAQIG